MTGFILNPYRLVVAGGGGGAPDEEFIARYTGTTASTADISLPSGYDIFRVQIKAETPNNFGEYESFLTTDNFSTVETSNYAGSAYVYRCSANRTAISIIGSGNQFEYFAGTFTANLAGICELKIFGTKDSAMNTVMMYRHGMRRNNTDVSNGEAVGWWSSTGTVDGIRLTHDSGSLTYEVNVWGVPTPS